MMRPDFPAFSSKGERVDGFRQIPKLPADRQQTPPTLKRILKNGSVAERGVFLLHHPTDWPAHDEPSGFHGDGSFVSAARGAGAAGIFAVALPFRNPSRLRRGL
jgi:hypothetical protein